MRVKPRRHELAAGLALSALVHLLIFGWNPVLQFVAERQQGGAAAASRPSPDQLISYVLVPGTPDEDEDDASALPAAAPRRMSRPAGGAEGAAPDGLSRTRAPLQPQPAVPGAIERLRTPTVRIPIAPAPPETQQERVQREFEARERATRGDRQPVYIPPATTTIPRVLGGGLNAGVSIPVGPAPPPRAQTVPAPRPPAAVLRRDSLRAAAIVDSIRADQVMRDSLQRQLRRRPPASLPRVRPDTLPY